MLLPFRLKAFKLAQYKFRYIVLHDTSCMFSGVSQVKIDDNKSQLHSLRDYNWILNARTEVNYHFVVEKIGNDYESLIGRPLNYLCQYDDIPLIYNERAIHVCLMGSYSIIKPKPRYYQQLVYRVISPLMFHHRITSMNIVTHQDISTNEELKCPGELFNMDEFRQKVTLMKIR